MRASCCGNTRASDRSCGRSASANQPTSEVSWLVVAAPPVGSQTKKTLAQENTSGGVTLPGAVPQRGELQHPDRVAALLQRFLGRVFRRRAVHVGPAARQGPAPAVGRLAHHQQALARVEHGGADVDLRRRVTGLAGEQFRDPLDRRVGPRREHFRGERAQRLVALAVIGVAREGQAGLGDRLQLAGPGQPIGFVARHAAALDAAPPARSRRRQARRRRDTACRRDDSVAALRPPKEPSMTLAIWCVLVAAFLPYVPFGLASRQARPARAAPRRAQARRPRRARPRRASQRLRGVSVLRRGGDRVAARRRRQRDGRLAGARLHRRADRPHRLLSRRPPAPALRLLRSRSGADVAIFIHPAFR